MNQMTFVCCIESGFLEDQTIRLVQSIRLFGGNFADTPIIAVIPRFSLPLANETKKQLSINNVQVVSCKEDPEYGWFKYYNKPRAMECAEKIATTEQICWLDSDMIFTGQPDELLLADDEDFAAHPAEIKEMGTSGPGDAYYPLWLKFCEATGIALDDLPLLKCDESGELVHMYFNGGIFVYRTKSQFGAKYLALCRDLLNTKVITSVSGFTNGVKEMSALGLVVTRDKLRWKPLSYTHNFPIGNWIPDLSKLKDKMASVSILHHHNAMYPAYWPVFIEVFGQALPNVHEWLSPLGPLGNKAPLLYRALNKLLAKRRIYQEKIYNQSCIDINSSN
jgi:hypothetical protein